MEVDDDFNLWTDFFTDDHTSSPPTNDAEVAAEVEVPPMATTRRYRKWTAKEDRALKAGMHKHPGEWAAIARCLKSRTAAQVRERWLSVLRPNTRRHGPWTEDEDRQLTAAVRRYGDQWAMIAQSVPNRTMWQCRRRWKGAIGRGTFRRQWTPAEDEALLRSIHERGVSNWYAIAKDMPYPRQPHTCRQRWWVISGRQ